MRFVVSFILFVVVPYLKPRGSFVDTLCASYDAIMLHIFQNLIYYRGGDWMLVKRMLELNMVWNLVQIKVNEKLQDWTLRSKFNAILELVSDSDIHLSKLDSMLKGFAIGTSNDFKSKTFNGQHHRLKVMLVLVLQYGIERRWENNNTRPSWSCGYAQKCIQEKIWIWKISIIEGGEAA